MRRCSLPPGRGRVIWLQQEIALTISHGRICKFCRQVRKEASNEKYQCQHKNNGDIAIVQAGGWNFITWIGKAGTMRERRHGGGDMEIGAGRRWDTSIRPNCLGSQVVVKLYHKVAGLLITETASSKQELVTNALSHRHLPPSPRALLSQALAWLAQWNWNYLLSTIALSSFQQSIWNFISSQNANHDSSSLGK